MVKTTKSIRGFTLIELLVVISIIGVLMGLLLPAVQAVRESARNAECKNKLKQIGLAIQNYQTVRKGALPINWGDGTKDSGNTRGHSWMTYILPYMEEDALYNRIALNQAVGNSMNDKIAARPLPAFICGSDSHDSILEGQPITSGGILGKTNYKAVMGANWEGTDDGKFKYCKKDDNYHGRNWDKFDGREYGDGVIPRGYRGSGAPLWVTKLRDVRDGSSHTFMIGEALPRYCERSAWYWWDASTATCAIPLNYNPPDLDMKEYSTPDKWKTNSSFRSAHPGGGNFCFVDGHVDTVMDEINITAYRAHATIDGQELIDEDEL